MTDTHTPTCTAILAAALAALALAQPAIAEVAVHPVVAAVRHGDCKEAVDRINAASTGQDGETLFWGARMIYEGICVDPDHATAARYYRRAAELGVAQASVEHAVDLGLGVEERQSYDEAGAACEAGGATSDSQRSGYTVGYACTLAGLTGRLLRHGLPAGAVHGQGDPLRLEVSPATGEVRIVSHPRVALETDAPVGSHRRHPVVDLDKVVEIAWTKALAIAPKPEASRLERAPISVVVNLDMELESAPPAASTKEGVPGLEHLMTGDMYRGGITSLAPAAAGSGTQGR